MLGIQNVVPKSIEEQRVEDVSLEESTKGVLLHYYQSIEKEMYYGMTRKLVARCFKGMGLFDSKEEKVKYYRLSGYWKKRNQVVSGFTQREFLLTFQTYLEARRKKSKDPGYKEVLFLQDFII